MCFILKENCVNLETASNDGKRVIFDLDKVKIEKPHLCEYVIKAENWKDFYFTPADTTDACNYGQMSVLCNRFIQCQLSAFPIIGKIGAFRNTEA